MGLLEIKKEPGSAPEVVANVYLPSKEDEEKYSILTSFNYNQFNHFIQGSELADRALLSNAKKVYEDYLSRACAVPNNKDDKKDDDTIDHENRQVAMFEIYVKLGHINLLALDFAKALFAYQHAIKINTTKFRSSRSALYGVGLVYFHFKAYNACVEAFNYLLYLDSDLDFAHEVHVRLGIAHKNLGNFAKAAKHLTSAFDDVKNTQLFTKLEIKFHIAHCFDASGDLKTAFEEYKTLKDDPAVRKDPKLLANVYRALGWICFRTETTSFAQKSAKLNEANEYLKDAVKIDDFNSRTSYYLGRCYSEIPSGANEAFHHYRSAIDKNEHDADTWCSIGVLYQLQNQDTDALQAFICAIQINQNHNQAWACLGKLYESHFQYREALHCYKKAVYHNSSYPEPLKRRIQVLQKALSENAPLLSRFRSSTYKNVQPLPDFENAWNLGIPAELRPHQRQSLTLQKYSYRSGSLLWRMSELSAAYSVRLPFELNATQREIMHILQLNEDQLEKNELNLLRHLEERFRRSEPANDRQRYQAAETTVSNESKREGMTGDPEMRTFPFEMDFLSQLNEPSTSGYNPDEPNPPKGGELPANFSLLAPIHVPITVTADELLEKCNKRMMNPESYIPIFDENCPPPKPDVIPLKQRPTLDKLAPKTPLIKVEKPHDANSQELQNFCYKSPIALIRGLTGALKMDLSLFSTKSLIETTPDYPVEVRTQYRMPGDINVDQLGQPSWNCYSAKSHTTIGRYGAYQAESFRHSLKEETERLRAAGTGSKYAIAAAQAAAAGTPLGTIATTAPAASLLSISTPTKNDGAPPAKRRRTGQAAVNASGDKLAAAAVLAGGPDDLPIGHMPMKIVKFGTNVDLSDEAKFPLQLRELNKMPAFCRNSATCNFLSHLGHTVLGMNTVQLYMKVPGCRTPGHLENNCFASVNINIGPGECEWFGVDYEYWPVIDKMCKERGIDLMKGSWWPNFEDLVRARVPVYRFTQKAGDLVWVGGGCVHWVQSVGWCNNVAWNVGPMTAEQLQMALYSHEWNKLTNYRSLVPMQHLCWQLAINVRFSNQKIFNTVKGVLIRSLAYCRMIFDFVTTRTKMQIKRQERIKGETAHYCHTCDIEVFNYLFVKEFHNKFKVFCVQCAKKAHFEDYIVLEQQTIKELSDTFDRFQLYPAKTPLLC